VSIYGWFACRDCKVKVWLGKALRENDNDQPTRFQIRDTHTGDPLNSENPILNKVIWKMLADHATHSIGVFVEGYNDDDAIYEYKDIGGDEIGDITFEEYLKGWKG
jgi:hypothetical protein